MTMKLKITNEDSSRTAKLITIDGGVDSRVEEIPPGGSAEVWLHSTRSVRLEEKVDEAPQK